MELYTSRFFDLETKSTSFGSLLFSVKQNRRRHNIIMHSFRPVHGNISLRKDDMVVHVFQLVMLKIPWENIEGA